MVDWKKYSRITPVKRDKRNGRVKVKEHRRNEREQNKVRIKLRRRQFID
ncbi:MAG TPA: hypothetical protein VE572_05730 [Nitrososphaeraceae archaeon]|nr:hypothetical protein [Nitrososphaeraceae archaeon]